ncbi:hypothetical protein DB346_11935 [Verrucomicrobia bacterium LW23]|nr:hypothetical protein DB346_11935 [Verrucomicrobia bacterium LW23]
MKSDSDIEQQLGKLRPSPPSPGLKARIGAELARAAAAREAEEARVARSRAASQARVEDATPWTRALAHGWMRWIAPTAAAACAVLIAGVSLLSIGPVGPSAGFGPAVATVTSPMAATTATSAFRPLQAVAEATATAAPSDGGAWGEVPLGTEVSLVYDDRGRPMQVTRTATQASYTWEDAASRSSITTTFPREQIYISEPDFQ